MMKENPEFALAFEFVHATNRNIFLTGKAGTGKTTFLHKLREASVKRMVVVAPTGVAAINAGGVTIHSFFQMPFGPILPGRLREQHSQEGENRFIHRFNKRKINLIKTVDLVVIDEVSMVRADLLDGIDQVLRRFRNARLPFGGVQMLLIGDLQQLPPVVKPDEWNMLKPHYDTLFFFGSHAFQQANALSIELKHVYRQQDDAFLTILNEIRNNTMTESNLRALNARYIPDFRPGNEEGYIILTTHNASANRINAEHLNRLPASPFTFRASVEGNFPPFSFPADENLVLKEGAQVMFVKNDPFIEKRYYNGKIGTVAEIDEDSISVQCEDEDEPIQVERVLWENIKFTINQKTKAVEEEVDGTFYQFPLRLAWAITIHKSQGLTFEKAIIDARAAFAHGQTYVALSRCKTLEGLVLSSRIDSRAVILDGTIRTFNREVENHQPGADELQASRREYLLSLMEELFGFRQLQYQVGKLKQLAHENQSILLGNLQDVADHMLEKGTRVMDEVGKRFVQQLKGILAGSAEPESLPEFKERIAKAGQYFLGKTQTDLLEPLDSCRWDADNKIVLKEIAERMLKVKELLVVKIAGFGALNPEFTVQDFLQARAVASLQEVKLAKSKEKETLVAETMNPVLFGRLKKWRSEVALTAGIAHYRVASQKLLVALSNSLPVTTYQLKAVKGMGPKKVATYGPAIIDLIRDYARETGMEVGEDPDPGPYKKGPLKHTRSISLDLFLEGKSPAEIADDRKLTVETIEKHLGFFVANGTIGLDRLVLQAEQQKIIQKYLEDHPHASLGEAKEALGEGISWSALKFVKRYIEFLAIEKVGLDGSPQD